VRSLGSFPASSKPIHSLSDFLKKRTGIIAECKKRSPSAGVIRSEYDPVAIAKIYETCGASAISVLTDQNFFSGSVKDLENVAAAVGIPVIRKDFIIDEKQIEEARFFGASAILLIVRILSKVRLRELFSFSASFGMECLVEVHTESEANIALESGAKIIGINSRDLDTFQIDKDLIERIAKNLPGTVIRVGESGIENREDYLNIRKFTDSVLIGTYFMRSASIPEAFNALL